MHGIRTLSTLKANLCVPSTQNRLHDSILTVTNSGTANPTLIITSSGLPHQKLTVICTGLPHQKLTIIYTGLPHQKLTIIYTGLPHQKLTVIYTGLPHQKLTVIYTGLPHQRLTVIYTGLPHQKLTVIYTGLPHHAPVSTQTPARTLCIQGHHPNTVSLHSVKAVLFSRRKTRLHDLSDLESQTRQKTPSSCESSPNSGTHYLCVCVGGGGRGGWRNPHFRYSLVIPFTTHSVGLK